MPGIASKYVFGNRGAENSRDSLRRIHVRWNFPFLRSRVIKTHSREFVTRISRFFFCFSITLIDLYFIRHAARFRRPRRRHGGRKHFTSAFDENRVDLCADKNATTYIYLSASYRLNDYHSRVVYFVASAVSKYLLSFLEAPGTSSRLLSRTFPTL